MIEDKKNIVYQLIKVLIQIFLKIKLKMKKTILNKKEEIENEIYMNWCGDISLI